MPRKKNMNPIDEALAARTETQVKLAAERAAHDLKLWEAWKKDPSPETTRPLLQRFDPIFKSKSIQWKAPTVNPAAFKLELQTLAIKAFETYDPSRGAALRTHLDWTLNKARRFNNQQQNYAHIPEEKALLIGPIDSARDQLREELGRDPTNMEIADFVNEKKRSKRPLTEAKVKEIQKSRINDIIFSNLQADPNPQSISRDRQVIGLLRPALKPDEQVVFDYIYGLNGKPKMENTGDIARAMGKQPSQVSRLKTSILAQIDRYR